MKFATDEQKKFFLPRILTGEVFFCQGYSEPEAGSDLASLSMAAVDDGDDLVCTGSKIWTTHAGEANWIFALVRTSRSAKKQQGITFVLIDMSTPGIEIRPLVMTSGEKIQNQVFFDEVRVPQRYRIGAEGQGFIYQMMQFQEERLWAASSALQSLTTCIDLTVEWAQQRNLFGATLADQQWVQFKLAELKAEVESLRALTYRDRDLETLLMRARDGGRDRRGHAGPSRADRRFLSKVARRLRSLAQPHRRSMAGAGAGGCRSARSRRPDTRNLCPLHRAKTVQGRIGRVCGGRSEGSLGPWPG